MTHDPTHQGTRQSAMLELEGVTKVFAGDVEAVSEVTFEVQPGEFMFVLGPSGSGKTTTLRMIAGFENVTRGDIRLGGRSLGAIPIHDRDIGMVFQNYALFPHMSVGENIGFGMKMRGVPKRERSERVNDALALVRLPRDFGGRFPRQLSGGEQQRVALARAIAMEPAMLLLDEPLANLDRRLRDQMRVELKHIQSEIGTTTLFVTHDQEEALTLGDRIAVMDKGRVQQIAPPRTVYSEPANQFVAEFIGDINVLPAKIAEDAKSARLAFGPSLSVRWADEPSTFTGKALICVRPEQVALSTEPKEGGTDCVIRYIGFAGSVIRYVTELPDGSEFLIERQAEAVRMATHRVGDTLHIDWSARSWLAFSG